MAAMFCRGPCIDPEIELLRASELKQRINKIARTFIESCAASGEHLVCDPPSLVRILSESAYLAFFDEINQIPERYK